VERLALFDIDCTLIDAHGAGGRAILRAVKEVYGVEGALGEYSFHGRTDPGIVRDLVGLWGADGGDAGNDSVVQRCLERYLQLLAAEVAEGVIEVLPGMDDLVKALAADKRVLLGLLTGNVEAGARIKLAPTGLLPLFAVGAYGSDSGSRPELPAVAVRRAEAYSGRHFAGKEIVVIGDSPADVHCGAGLGVKTIAVATGRHSVAELAGHAPDFVFADFSDWRAAYEAVVT
jgi:phosphoglycolate phosphatase-like HAD superfamily hydrolase